MLLTNLMWFIGKFYFHFFFKYSIMTICPVYFVSLLFSFLSLKEPPSLPVLCKTWVVCLSPAWHSWAHQRQVLGHKKSQFQQQGFLPLYFEIPQPLCKLRSILVFMLVFSLLQNPLKRQEDTGIINCFLWVVKDHLKPFGFSCLHSVAVIKNIHIA